jgi:hypothetical protein
MWHKKQKLTTASWLRPVCGGFHNLIRFNCAPFLASCRRHRVLTVTCLDACRCTAYLTVVIECIFVEGHRRFEWTCSLQLQGWKTSVSLYKATRCNNNLNNTSIYLPVAPVAPSAGDTAGSSLDSQINNSQTTLSRCGEARQAFHFRKIASVAPVISATLGSDIAVKSLNLQTSISECKSELNFF